MSKRSIVFLSLISALFLIFASCKDNFFTTNGEIWSTSYHIVYGSDVNLNDSILQQFSIIDSELSMFNAESEVSAVNDGLSDRVGHNFREVFALSQRVCELSGGVYDPTIAPLVELWGFGRGEAAEAGDSAIAAALEAVGILECGIDGDRVIKKSPGTRFDFSSVAKGYGIDCIADMFERNGVANYMIEVGGEVAAAGLNPSGKPWHIQIDSPEGGMSHRRLTIKPLGPERSALASSGNYRNRRTDSAGRSYGHTISPKTGYPAESTILAATVMADRCGYADALATACMASGSRDSALAIIGRAGAEALIVDIDADTLRVTASAGW